MRRVFLSLSVGFLFAHFVDAQSVSGPGLNGNIICPGGNYTYTFHDGSCQTFVNIMVGPAGTIVSSTGNSVTVKWAPNRNIADYYVQAGSCSGKYFKSDPINFYQYRSAPAPIISSKRVNGKEIVGAPAVCEGDVITMSSALPAGYGSNNGYKIVWDISRNGTTLATREGINLTYTIPVIAGGYSRISFKARISAIQCGSSVLDSPFSSPSIELDVYSTPQPIIQLLEPICYNSSGGVIFKNLPNGKYNLSIDGLPNSQHTVTNTNPNITIGGLSGDKNYPTKIEAVKSNGEASSCVFETVINLITPAPPVLSVTHKNISCKGGADGSITAIGSGGSAPYRFFIDSLNSSGIWTEINAMTSNYATSHVFTGLQNGRYRVRAQDNRGCTVPVGKEVLIIEPSDYNIDIANQQHVTCFGEAIGGFTVNATGGNITEAYQYSSDDGVSWQESNVFNNMPAGEYRVRVRAKEDVSCLSKAIIHTIIQPESPISLNISAIEPACPGGMGVLIVEASGGTKGTEGYLFEVFDSSDNKINDQEDWGGKKSYSLPTGTYLVSVTDGNGCSIEVSKTIINPATISFTTESSQVTCAGASDGKIAVVDVINGAPPYTYSLDGTSFQSSSTFGGLSSKSYTIVVKDANGCTESKSIFISTKPALVAEITETQSISCLGSENGALQLTVVGGTPPYAYRWSNNATTKDLKGLSAGEYTVTITDQAGCTKVETYFLSSPNELTASPVLSDYNGVSISCNGSSDGFIRLEVAGGTEPYAYQWSTGATTSTLNNIGAGTYSATVTDAKGCLVEVKDIEIREPAAVSLTIKESTEVKCSGIATGIITVAASGGTGTYIYSIDEGVTWQNHGAFSGLSAGDHIIEAKDINGCKTFIDVTIIEPPILTATVTTLVDATCGGANGSAEAKAYGGVGSYTYTWRDISNTVVSKASILSGVNGGIYEVTIQDANGCSITKSANISSTDGPKITVINKTGTSCADSYDGKATITINGVGPFRVEWSNGETGTTPTKLNAGENVVKITDTNGCVAVEVIDIPAPDPISFSIVSSTMPSCYDNADGAIEVLAKGGVGNYTYRWSTGSISPKLEGVKAGSYTLMIRDENGCELEEEVVLESPSPIAIHITDIVAPSCIGGNSGSITVSATGGNGGYTFNWSTGEEGNTIKRKSAGSYQVTVTDVKGCSAVETVILEDPQPLLMDLGSDVTICSGSRYEISSPLEGSDYFWSSNNGFISNEKTIIVDQPGIYTLEVINEEGCKAKDSFELIVSNDLLRADFLMTSEAYVGDTVVVIEISWPAPEKVNWDFGEKAQVLKKDEVYAELVFEEAGRFKVSLEAGIADCINHYSQHITIYDKKEKSKGERNAGESNNLIREFQVYPNPSDGEFEVLIALESQAIIELVMVDLKGRIVFDKQLNNRSSYIVPIHLPYIGQGLYLLRLKSGNETKVQRILIK